MGEVDSSQERFARNQTSPAKMKCRLPCIRCLQDSERFDYVIVDLEYFDDRLSLMSCPNGHNYYVQIQNPKYEVLLASGAEALSAGFTLEACLTYGAALERFLEFGLRAMLLKLGCPWDLVTAQIKAMSAQSERQLGAFSAVYLQVCGAVFPSPDTASERNKFVHRGEIPDGRRAVKYCSKVYEAIFKIATELKRHCEPELKAAVTEEMKERAASVTHENSPTTASFHMIYSISSDNNCSTFEESYGAYLEHQKGSSQLLDLPREAVLEMRLARAAQRWSTTSPLIQRLNEANLQKQESESDGESN